MATSDRISVAVIGGGIGGLCLAIGLLKYPHLDVQVYEAAHKFSEIGAGVAVGPNAQRAMRLISPEIEAAFHGEVTANVSKEFDNTWFAYEYGEGPRCGEFISRVMNETGQATVHRAKYLEALVKLIPPGIAHFGKRLVELEERSDDVALHFKDGTSATAQCVIGADGVHSAVRKHLLGEGHPQLNPTFTHSVAYRGLVPMEKAASVIGDRYAKNSWIFVGKGACIMIYPIDHGTTMNVVAINSSVESWDGPWVQNVPVSQVESEFATWGKIPKGIISLMDPDNTAAWSMWDHPPAPFYAHGRICMLGDAAHCSTPFQGQGAGQAIEDSLVVSTLLGSVQALQDIPLAFAAYDKVRRPRSQRITQTSREAGELCALRLPGVEDSKEAFSENINWRMDWIWHRDIEGESREGKLYLAKLQKGEPIY